MCLHSIITTNLKKTEGEGYKVVIPGKGRTLLTANKRFPVPRNRWCCIPKNEIGRVLPTVYNHEIGLFQYYHFGFHILTSLKGAKAWKKCCHSNTIIIKVKYTNAHTLGSQENCRIVVANRMKFIKEVK